MLVKIGNQVFSSTTTIISIIFSEKEMEEIKSQPPDHDMFTSFPAGTPEEYIETFNVDFLGEKAKMDTIESIQKKRSTEAAEPLQFFGPIGGEPIDVEASYVAPDGSISKIEDADIETLKMLALQKIKEHESRHVDEKQPSSQENESNPPQD